MCLTLLVYLIKFKTGPQSLSLHHKRKEKVMTIETFDPSKTDIITVTKKAARHFRRQLDKAGQQAVRISLEERGCTGYAFVLDYISSPEKGDSVLNAEFDVTIAVAPDAQQYIRGTEIDYVLEGINETLKYNNPNAKDYCGCGESFNV
jgi:iron-sulfur cluster assembly accessory protein